MQESSFVEIKEEQEKVEKIEEEEPEIILVHDDLIEKEAFYTKYDLYPKLKWWGVALLF